MLLSPKASATGCSARLVWYTGNLVPEESEMNMLYDSVIGC